MKPIEIATVVIIIALAIAVPFALGGLLFPKAAPAGQTSAGGVRLASIVNGVQEISIRAGTNGYDIPVFQVKKGIPVRILFSADKYAGCGRQMIIPDFGVSAIANGGVTPIEFTPDKTGSFAFRCSMNMFRGTMIVTA